MFINLCYYRLLKVLLLADSIVVKQLLLDKETNTVGSVCIKVYNDDDDDDDGDGGDDDDDDVDVDDDDRLTYSFSSAYEQLCRVCEGFL